MEAIKVDNCPDVRGKDPSDVNKQAHVGHAFAYSSDVRRHVEGEDTKASAKHAQKVKRRPPGVNPFFNNGSGVKVSEIERVHPELERRSGDRLAFPDASSVSLV